MRFCVAAIEGGGKVSQAMTEMYDLEFAIKKLWPDKTQDERVSLMQQYIRKVDAKERDFLREVADLVEDMDSAEAEAEESEFGQVMRYIPLSVIKYAKEQIAEEQAV